MGEAVTRAFFEIWDEGSSDSAPMLAMLRAAVANEQATEQLRGFIEARLIEEGRSTTLEDHSSRQRAGVVALMLVGVIVGRRIVQVPTLAEMDREALVRLVSPGVQAVLGAVPSPPL